MNDIYDEYSRYHESNEIHPTAIIYPNVIMGKNNKIGPYSVIGSDGEIRGVDKFEGSVEIGSGNVISELVTIQRPSKKGAVTRVGDGNIIMAHSHVGHDASIGDECELSTGCVVGGYATIEDVAMIKLNATIRNRVTVGSGAVVGMGSVVTKNVDKESIVVGSPAKPLKK